MEDLDTAPVLTDFFKLLVCNSFKNIYLIEEY